MEELEVKLAESQRRADEHLADLTARQEQLKAVTTRKEAREARQAAVELRKRQMVMERDLHYREAKLKKMRLLRDKMEAEQRLRYEEISEMEKVQVTISTMCFQLSTRSRSSNGASAAKEPGHFEVRTSSNQVTRIKTQRPPLRLFQRQNKTNKVVSGQIW